MINVILEQLQEERKRALNKLNNTIAELNETIKRGYENENIESR